MKSVFHSLRVKSPSSFLEAWESLTSSTRQRKSETFLNFVFGGEVPSDVDFHSVLSMDLVRAPMAITDTSFWCQREDPNTPPNVTRCIPLTVFAELASSHFGENNHDNAQIALRRLRGALAKARVLDFEYEHQALASHPELSPLVPDDRILACVLAIRAQPGGTGRVATLWSRDRGLMIKALRHNIHSASHRGRIHRTSEEQSRKPFQENLKLSRAYHQGRERKLYGGMPLYPASK